MRGDRPTAAPPFLIVFNSVSSVTLFISPQSVKFLGLTGKEADIRPSPLPLTPWQLAQDFSNIALASSSENAGIEVRVALMLATNNAKQVTDARRILTTFLFLPSVLGFSTRYRFLRQKKGAEKEPRRIFRAGRTLSRPPTQGFHESALPSFLGQSLSMRNQAS